jgi:hypothetical protein
LDLLVGFVVVVVVVVVALALLKDPNANGPRCRSAGIRESQCDDGCYLFRSASSTVFVFSSDGNAVLWCSDDSFVDGSLVFPATL